MMKTKLEDVLKRAARLLVDCDIQVQASWFNDQLEKLTSNNGEETLKEVATNVRSIIAGMGSFSDLSLEPSGESGLSEKEANALKWRMVDELDALTEEILR